LILGLDTDVVVHWAMEGAPHHRAVRGFVELQVSKHQHQLGLTPQVLHELLHVCTDPRRFDRPLPMAEAIDLVRALWDGEETVRIVPAPAVLHRTLELLTTLRLGRKRILDTALAATLEAAGVRRLVTLNGSDFRIFSFLAVVDPLKQGAGSRSARQDQR
jgi:predicted nucleic acid-binding protein